MKIQDAKPGTRVCWYDPTDKMPDGIIISVSAKIPGQVVVEWVDEFTTLTVEHVEDLELIRD